MSKRMFTKEQVKDLGKNKNVSKCSEKSITYSKDFKMKAVKQYGEEGITSSEIFRQAGFDLVIIGKDIPKQSLKRWNRAFKAKGLNGLAELRGKRGKTTATAKIQTYQKIESGYRYVVCDCRCMPKWVLQVATALRQARERL